MIWRITSSHLFLIEVDYDQICPRPSPKSEEYFAENWLCTVSVQLVKTARNFKQLSRFGMDNIYEEKFLGNEERDLLPKIEVLQDENCCSLCCRFNSITRGTQIY